MRAPIDSIIAPPFPLKAKWINSAPLRMDQQRDRPVLVEFWDFCRHNSLRTLPYLKRWHQKYEPLGLRVIGIHAGGFSSSQDEENVIEAVAKLDISYPVIIDSNFELWDFYGNEGWPSRYLWAPGGKLYSRQIGEGAYSETESEIAELLDISAAPIALLRDEDHPDAELCRQSDEQPGAYSGPYEAKEIWLVADGFGSVLVNNLPVKIAGPGCYRVVKHDNHAKGIVEIEPSDEINCYATCFSPGVAAN